MSRKIISYKLVSESSAYELNSEVADYIERGYQPRGMMQHIDHGYSKLFTQVVVKYEEPPAPEPLDPFNPPADHFGEGNFRV